ncbi:Nsp1-like C-terminal region-domain-containing protein [Mycena filopes]|nr:Nsp1-like C-terminal region-domain-containing protein [Mycena filopes]
MSFFNNPAPSGAGTPPATSNIFGANPGGGLFGGGTTSAAPASGGLFGGNSSTPSSGGSFGNNNATPAPASGGIFGGAPANSAAKPQPSLFGGAPAGGSSNMFGGSTSTSTPPTTGIFGTSSQPPGSNPLFGGASIKPADPASNQQKPASSFFNTPTSSTAPSTGAFNLPAKPAAASTTAPTNSLFAAPAPSPFSLGGNKDAATGPAPAAGGFFAKPASTTPAPAANAPASSPFSLSLAGGKDGGAATSAPSLFAPKPDATPGFSLTKPKEGEKAPTPLAGASSSVAGPVVAVAPPSMLRGKTIEEIVNKWSGELETHVREFNKFAGEVAVWDRALIENGNNLAALYSHVLAAEREQNDIDQSLDHIEQQQKDLSSTLDAYEKATQEVFGGHGGNLRALDTGPADTERDKNYMLATDLHTQLDDLSGSLTQMIESVNGLSLPSGLEDSSDDPMGQIAQILGSHLESLQWIDGAVREVEGKVTEVEKRVKDSGYNPGASSAVKRGYGL